MSTRSLSQLEPLDSLLYSRHRTLGLHQRQKHRPLPMIQGANRPDQDRPPRPSARQRDFAMPNMKQVAAMARVSLGTVSNASTILRRSGAVTETSFPLG